MALINKQSMSIAEVPGRCTIQCGTYLHEFGVWRWHNALIMFFLQLLGYHVALNVIRLPPDHFRLGIFDKTQLLHVLPSMWQKHDSGESTRRLGTERLEHHQLKAV